MQNPGSLGVLYPLLMVEGQGAHLRASGIRKQVMVCSADAGVCHAWKGESYLCNAILLYRDSRPSGTVALVLPTPQILGWVGSQVLSAWPMSVARDEVRLHLHDK